MGIYFNTFKRLSNVVINSFANKLPNIRTNVGNYIIKNTSVQYYTVEQINPIEEKFFNDVTILNSNNNFNNNLQNQEDNLIKKDDSFEVVQKLNNNIFFNGEICPHYQLITVNVSLECFIQNNFNQKKENISYFLDLQFDSLITKIEKKYNSYISYILSGFLQNLKTILQKIVKDELEDFSKSINLIINTFYNLVEGKITLNKALLEIKTFISKIQNKPIDITFKILQEIANSTVKSVENNINNFLEYNNQNSIEYNSQNLIEYNSQNSIEYNNNNFREYNNQNKYLIQA